MMHAGDGKYMLRHVLKKRCMLVMGTVNCGRVAHAVENSLLVHLLQYLIITINRKNSVVVVR
jgi:hypothetical protein